MADTTRQYIVIFTNADGSQRVGRDRIGEREARFSTKEEAQAFGRATKRAWGRRYVKAYTVREAA